MERRGRETTMRIISPGKPEKTGLQRLECPNCQAVLEILNKDIKVHFYEQYKENRKMSYEYIVCPECGKMLVKPENRQSDWELS
jgi:uncharacterized protein with PIN domain